MHNRKEPCAACNAIISLNPYKKHWNWEKYIIFTLNVMWPTVRTVTRMSTRAVVPLKCEVVSVHYIDACKEVES